MRNFKPFIISSIAIAGLLIFSTNTFAQNAKMDGTLAHQVFFWLKDSGNPEVQQKFEKAISELLTIKEIKQSHLGRPANTQEREVTDHSFSYSMILIFDSKEAQDAYQVHPLHQKFVEENKDLWNKVIVYDSVEKTE